MTGEGGEGEENCHPLITSLLNEGAVIKIGLSLKLAVLCNLGSIQLSFSQTKTELKASWVA